MHIHRTEPSRKRGTSGRHLAAGEEGSGGKLVGEGLAGAGRLRAVVTQSYTLLRQHAKSVAPAWNMNHTHRSMHTSTWGQFQLLARWRRCIQKQTPVFSILPSSLFCGRLLL